MEEITDFIEATLPGAQAVDAKRPQLTVDGGVNQDLLPEVLHVALLCLVHIARHVLGNGQQRLANVLQVHVGLPQHEEERVVIVFLISSGERARLYIFL